MTAPVRINGLSAIATEYDCLICDVWGVIHNGRTPYPSAVAAMQEYRRTRGPVILLSNAPRLATDVQRQLDKLAVARDAHDVIVTSGEATRAEIARRAREKRLPLLHIGPERDNGVFEGLDVRLTNVDEADIVLTTGLYDDEKEEPENYRPVLERMAQRGLAMICANPDVVVQRGERLIYCAGAIARLYDEMGGTTVYYGKPHEPVFHAAIAAAKQKGAGERPLVIGDNLETDIAGANRVGLDALFIAGGIHGADLAKSHESVNVLLAHSGVRARAWMNVLAW
jgi:HAD superfamily hydrolase (TIGR01459 family)